MTPAQAKTTWCPFAQALLTATQTTTVKDAQGNVTSTTELQTTVAANRDSNGYMLPETKCIATYCQCWVTTGPNNGTCAFSKAPAPPSLIPFIKPR